MQCSSALDEQTLRRILQRAYGHLAPREAPAALPLGHPGLWCARLATGQRVVLKLGPLPGQEGLTHDADRVRAEVEALQMIAEHTDVPVPAMHQVDDSFELVEADWLCMEFLDGTPLDRLAADEQRRVMPHVEAAMARLEAIEGEGFGRFLQPQLDSWADAFTGGVEDLLADATRLGVDLGVSADEVHSSILAHADALDEVSAPHFVEWDRRPADVLVGPSGPSALLDHTATLWGDPLMASRWMAATQPALTPWQGTLRPRLRPLDDDELLRRRLYDVFVMLAEVLLHRDEHERLPAARAGLRSTLDVLTG